MIDASFELFGTSGPLAVVVLFLGLICFWLWAEFRSKLALRVLSATLVVSTAMYLAYYVGWLGPQYTITYYEAAIREAAITLETADPDSVARVFREYEESRDPAKPEPLTLRARLEALREHAAQQADEADVE